MCLKYWKSKTSEILEISRNKCTLKIGCVLLSLQVARCLSSGEQRHNHPLDRHHHRRHISVEEDLKSTPTSSPTSSPSSATWTPSSTSPRTRWLFLEFYDSYSYWRQVARDLFWLQTTHLHFTSLHFIQIILRVSHLPIFSPCTLFSAHMRQWSTLQWVLRWLCHSGPPFSYPPHPSLPQSILFRRDPIKSGTSQWDLKNPKFKIRSSKFKVQSSKFKVQSSKFKVQRFAILLQTTATAFKILIFCLLGSSSRWRRMPILGGTCKW